MLRTTKCVLLLATAIAMIALPAWAGEQPGEGSAAQEGRTGTSESFKPRLAKANDLTGLPVKNSQGQQLGKLANIVLNLRQNQAACGIVMFENRMRNVPWQAMRLSSDSKSIMLEMSQEQFKQSPSFEKGSLPSFNQQWMQKNMEFYQKHAKHLGKHTGKAMEEGSQLLTRIGQMKGSESEESEESDTSREEMARMSESDLRPLCHVIGLNVTGTNGQRLGTLEEVIIDTNEGQLAYAVVSHASTTGTGEKYSAVPWDAMRADLQRQTYALDVSADVLNTYTYTDQDFSKLSDMSYARQIASAYDAEPYWQTYAFAPTRERRVASWLAGSAYNRNFNSRAVQSVKGKIHSVGSYWPTAASASGIRLRLSTADGGVHTVYAGPWGYAMRQQFAPARQQQITIKACQATIQSEKVWIASEVTSNGKTLRLYDDQGKPQWNASQVMMPSESSESNESTRLPSLQ